MKGIVLDLHFSWPAQIHCALLLTTLFVLFDEKQKLVCAKSDSTLVEYLASVKWVTTYHLSGAPH